MFSQDQQKYKAVVITVNEGSEIKGQMLCGLSGTIESALNNDSPFIQLKEGDEISFISKAQIAKLVPEKNPNQTMPKLKPNNQSSGNWSEILGVMQTATPEQVRIAYYEKAKAYHPDMFSIDMPIEVKEYASIMLSRINIAYDQFKAFKKAA